jgi:hypothetical protein
MTTRLIKALIVVGFILGLWRLGQAQTQVAQFHFTIRRTATGVAMACSQGCAWKTLSFGLSGDRVQAVDGMGMAEK